jgi:hypothetical protein
VHEKVRHEGRVVAAGALLSEILQMKKAAANSGGCSCSLGSGVAAILSRQYR